ncbi:SAM-dependent methyltransferase [Streptomyces aureocirculatus]|uniref:SAM-dependent methyltransferase n=1 Tax=Streptomyces aureocirculatus TaxID=67275 RepID=UPI0004C90578|nr:SAM-dependent methyltransferase [Streptomyces aureocirculatus]
MTDSGFDSAPIDIDTSVPHSARIYDYLLDGKDNYAADRKAADEITALFPDVRAAAWANREYMQRAARFLAERDVDQYLDIGTGIPTEPNLHQVVQEIVVDARVVYADNDPIVLAHAEALLRGTRQGRTAYVSADVRNPESVLAYAREHLDFRRPIALSLVSVLQFVSDPYDPFQVIRQMLEPLAPGSYLVLSHVTYEFEPEIWERIDAIYQKGPDSMKARSREDFSRFFDGLELCAPGIVVATQWQPDSHMTVRDGRVPLYAAVARKP